MDNFTTALKALTGRLKNDKLRLGMQQALPFWIASLITGLIAVFYARLFAWAEGVGISILHIHKWFIFILAPVCFMIARLLVRQFSPYARGSGIPQVMAAIELANPKENKQVNKLLNIKVIIIKMLSSMLMVIGGAAVGREGPTIQIAGTVFRKINEWMPKSWPKISKKNMILTGAAAGLAAAFNTPLGGIVFAVEELAKTHISYFKTAIFTAVIIAGLTAQALLGPYLYLGYPDVTNLSGYILLVVAGVAFICGAGGAYMSQLILDLMAWKKKRKNISADILFSLGVAVIISIIAYFINDGILGSGKEQMSRILFTTDKYAGWQLPIARIIGPILCFSTGSAGGVFAPALGAGATIGSFIAGLLHLAAANTNILVLAGMVGFLTGVTRSPFTSAILVLEMTDRHAVIFHLMLAGMVASIAASLISKHSFYDHLKHQYIVELRDEEKTEVADNEHDTTELVTH